MPIARSMSLENIAIRPKSNSSSPSHSSQKSRQESPQLQQPCERDILLQDLDSMLRNNLRLSNKISSNMKRSFSSENIRHSKDNTFRKRSGLEGDIVTRSPPFLEFGEDNCNNDNINADNIDQDDGNCNESDDENGLLLRSEIPSQGNLDIPDESEDDDEFTNVDEIDSPLIGHLQDGKMPSQNWDKVPESDNNNNNNGRDYNLPVNDEFQKNLDKRAEEILNGTLNRTIEEPSIDWEFKDFYCLQDELNDWYCNSDFLKFPQSKGQFYQMVKLPEKFLKDDSYAREMIDMLFHASNLTDSALMTIFFISMGTFSLTRDMSEQLEQIRRNNLLLIPHLDTLLENFKKIAIKCRDSRGNLKKHSSLLFYSSSVIYFIVCVCIENRDNAKVNITITAFYEARILEFLTFYIEQWRWNSRLSMRIRNIILLLFKLLVLQFGDKNLYNETKSSLYELHGLEPHKRKYGGYAKGSTKLSISPLHYRAFRDDITSRFPDYSMETTKLPIDSNDSCSLSQFLEIPRSKSSNPINMNLAIPEQHIATPFPSPPASPQLLQLSDTPRLRKSFQTNMLYPCLYPSDDENGSDALTERIKSTNEKENNENNIMFPYSIDEAATILSDNLKVKLSTKQLWQERDMFMKTERGWKSNDTDMAIEPNDSISDDDIAINYMNMSVDDYSCSMKKPIEIMKRIDSYYKDCFSSLNALVSVLLQTMESNLNNVFYKRTEVADDGGMIDLSNKDEIEKLKPYLEILRMKEISLKASSGILFVLLKWFKLNHVLKFEQLSVLLYDSRYINISMSLLNKYSENYAERVCGKIITNNGEFWATCSQYNNQYSENFISLSPNDASDIRDTMILPSLAYMLRILRKIIDSKTQRLKELPLSVGTVFKKYYRLKNLDIYHPILRIIKELTPFKNKRWKSEHMELISGVFLYEELELIDNWVTGKDIAGEINDACGQEIALRALMQFYNFRHYGSSMEALGYAEKGNLLHSEPEYSVL
ncbi:Far11p NDAI_0F02860 [Naumovozyma dairenensis CBS 421]|uniref:Factor arrest protein 11 n=1 Tax=Naumovozyma dairenensis (strain ATCC 10597 / BCRC 20456 / CBS 421 / NBRC 0211 / NRRL Y-12639) TaxID=1071378 RepID=G0WCU3_NAUDC|nr:hypothetical protein NDAI_0F02860 [Naumovozyma dairenensis CBS 421]CCD25604.1 hypothetical protein NDAI_0F02860 [Naumovozyma dairenensis CBS 421]